MRVSLAIKIIPRLCQGLPYSGNDSGRIQEVFNRTTTCMYSITVTTVEQLHENSVIDFCANSNRTHSQTIIESHCLLAL